MSFLPANRYLALNFRSVPPLKIKEIGFSQLESYEEKNVRVKLISPLLHLGIMYFVSIYKISS